MCACVFVLLLLWIFQCEGFPNPWSIKVAKCIWHFFFYWHHIPPMQWALLSSGTVTVYLQKNSTPPHKCAFKSEAVALAPPTISRGPTTAGWWITTCASCDFSRKCHHSRWRSHLWHQLLIRNRSMYSSASVNINAKHVHSQSMCVVNALTLDHTLKIQNAWDVIHVLMLHVRCNTCGIKEKVEGGSGSQHIENIR